MNDCTNVNKNARPPDPSFIPSFGERRDVLESGEPELSERGGADDVTQLPVPIFAGIEETRPRSVRINEEGKFRVYRDEGATR